MLTHPQVHVAAAVSHYGFVYPHVVVMVSLLFTRCCWILISSDKAWMDVFGFFLLADCCLARVLMLSCYRSPELVTICESYCTCTELVVMSQSFIPVGEFMFYLTVEWLALLIPFPLVNSRSAQYQRNLISSKHLAAPVFFITKKCPVSPYQVIAGLLWFTAGPHLTLTCFSSVPHFKDYGEYIWIK